MRGWDEAPQRFTSKRWIDVLRVKIQFSETSSKGEKPEDLQLSDPLSRFLWTIEALVDRTWPPVGFQWEYPFHHPIPISLAFACFCR